MKLMIRFSCRPADLWLLGFYILVAVVIDTYAPNTFLWGGFFGVIVAFIGDGIVDLILLNMRKP